MSENISDNINGQKIFLTMADSPKHNAANSSTPNTTWVQFDETDGQSGDGVERSSSAGGTPVRRAASGSQTTSSGVSSARGSVKSLTTQQKDANSSNSMGSPEGAHISVSEIEVVYKAKFV